jgi:hypothetical protein
MEGGGVGHKFGRDPPKDHPCQVITPNLAGMVLRWAPFKIVSDTPALPLRWLLLVEIHSVVSEEKIFFKFHPPFFSNLHNRSKSVKVQSS